MRSPRRRRVPRDRPRRRSARLASNVSSRRPCPLVTETLHSLERADSRPPLYVMVSTDGAGRVLYAAACDPDDYQ
jgi:hypothetical protein